MYKVLIYSIVAVFLAGCSFNNTASLEKQKILPPPQMTLKEDKLKPKPVCPPPSVEIIEKVVIKIKEVPKKEELILTIGEVEYVSISSLDITQKARIDTGAKTTSIHAVDIKEFERDGKKWVKFKLEDNDGQLVEKVLPLHRIVRIKQESDMESDRRYVVNMKLQLGSMEQLVEVSLNDRSHLNYPVLIGRNFLRGLFVVDVSKKFVLKEAKK